MAKDVKINAFWSVTSCNETCCMIMQLPISVVASFTLTSMCIEHQSISLIMKNLPSPPIFFTIRDKVTRSPTRQVPQSKLLNFLQCGKRSVLDVSLFVLMDCKVFSFVSPLATQSGHRDYPARYRKMEQNGACECTSLQEYVCSTGTSVTDCAFLTADPSCGYRTCDMSRAASNGGNDTQRTHLLWHFVRVRLPLSIGGSRYPRNLIITGRPSCTFTISASSGSSRTSQRKEIVSFTRIPGGIPLLCPLDSIATTNRESPGLVTNRNLAKDVLTFRNETAFCNERRERADGWVCTREEEEMLGLMRINKCIPGTTCWIHNCEIPLNLESRLKSFPAVASSLRFSSSVDWPTTSNDPVFSKKTWRKPRNLLMYRKFEALNFWLTEATCALLCYKFS